MAEPTLEQYESRDEWLAARMRGVGASDVGAILGLSKWATPMDVYLVKRGLVVVPDNAAMARGRRFEGTAAEMYEEQRGLRVTAPPAHALYRHHAETWATCTPDRTAEDGRRLVELKTANYSQAHRWGEVETNDVPDEYAVQVLWQMFVMDRDAADLAVLLFLREPELRVYHLERDRELEAAIVERVRAFWLDHVVAGVPPDIGWSDLAGAWVKGKFPRPTTGKIVRATPEQAQKMGVMRQVRAQIARLEERDAELKNALTDAIGENVGIEADGIGTILWRESKGRVKVAWEELARALVPREVLAEALPRHTAIGSPTRSFVPRWEARGDDPGDTSET